MAEQSNASLWHCGAKQRCGEAMDDLPAAAKHSTDTQWNCLAWRGKGIALRCKAAVKQRKPAHCCAVELLCAAVQRHSTAKYRSAQRRHWIARICDGKARRSSAMRSKAMELHGLAQRRLVSAKRRNDLPRHSSAWYGKGKAKCSTAKRRQCTESHGIETRRQCIGSRAWRGNGIEKRRRDLQRHCIATLVMAVAKHGPAWQCQGIAWIRAAMQRQSLERHGAGFAQPGSAGRRVGKASLRNASHRSHKIQPPQPIQRKRRTT